LPGRHRALVTAFLLAVAAWALYFPSLRSDFVYYDDIRILKDHPELYGQPSLSADLRAIFVTCFPREEPLLVRDVSWAIDSRLFGFGNAFGYHLINVALHGIVVGLLFVFLLGATGRYGFALAVALGFLVLALHTEPVAWIMGRKDLLSAMFMLLALCAQTKRLASISAVWRAAWYGFTLASFLAGLLSKISGLTFPLVLFLHAVLLPYLRGERPPGAPLQWRRNLAVEGLLLAPALAISAVIYVWYQRTLDQMGIFDRGYSTRGLAHLWNLLMVDPLAFWLYLRQTFFPRHLAVLYTWPAHLPRYPYWQIAASLATVAALAVLGFWLFRRRKDLFFYYAAFFVLMVPYLNLLFVGIWVADRYLYFSAFCLLALAASVVFPLFHEPAVGEGRAKAFPLRRMGALAFCALFLILNAFQTFSYQRAWRNAETLWQYHLTLPRPSPTAFENLAAYYYALAAQHPDPASMAVPISKMSIVIEAGLDQFWPDRSQPPPVATAYLFFLKSIVQEVTGEPEAALQSLLTSDRLKPAFDATNLNLAELYRKLAQKAADPVQRRTYACAARDRFSQYVKLAFRGRPARPEIQQELATLEAEAERR
jgi:hypothetical protein